MQLVLVDFDGTLTKKDSLLEFAKFCIPKRSYRLALIRISIPYALSKAGILSSSRLKQLFFRYTLKGMPQQKLEQQAEQFVQRALPPMLYPDGIEMLRKHKAQGDTVCIVSASATLWLTPFTRAFGLDLIGTELLFESGKFTGKMGPNCKGKEKVRRILEKYELKNYAQIIAYGNSRDDREMLQLAHKSYYKAFN